MAIQVLMPKIGLTMTEGKVVEWRKKEGERVEKGEVLFVFETEKTTFEVEAPESGILSKILVQVEEIVPVGTVVGLIALVGEAVEIPREKPVMVLAEKEERPKEVRRPSVEKIRATPLAKKMAKEKGLELKSVPGSGMGGMIRGVDIERFLSSQPAVTAPPVIPERAEKGRLVKFTGMRRIIGQKMLASKVETAQIYMSSTIDATRILDARERLLPVIEEKVGVRLTITDILMKITTVAISHHPVINTRWTPEGILWLEDIHMGMAMALQEGLIVPVIWDIGKKSLSEIARTRAELVEKGRKGKLTPDDMKGSTFTFSSLGMYGIEEFCPIINQPESAILGIGAIIDKPVVINKEITVRPMMKATLSYDHRVIYGAKAAEFIKTLKELMEDPVLALT
ncbi:MAG: 2-oxo acid dehydrogenase subunit E2 [Deltaproteobacteria bacterium]|nr:2-oxo acid dehydrogenase subunit E2 [Deltaproteobacteria bacterium]